MNALSEVSKCQLYDLNKCNEVNVSKWVKIKHSYFCVCLHTSSVHTQMKKENTLKLKARDFANLPLSAEIQRKLVHRITKHTNLIEAIAVSIIEFLQPCKDSNPFVKYFHNMLDHYASIPVTLSPDSPRYVPWDEMDVRQAVPYLEALICRVGRCFDVINVFPNGCSIVWVFRSKLERMLGKQILNEMLEEEEFHQDAAYHRLSIVLKLPSSKQSVAEQDLADGRYSLALPAIQTKTLIGIRRLPILYDLQRQTRCIRIRMMALSVINYQKALSRRTL